MQQVLVNDDNHFTEKPIEGNCQYCRYPFTFDPFVSGKSFFGADDEGNYVTKTTKKGNTAFVAVCPACGHHHDG